MKGSIHECSLNASWFLLLPLALILSSCCCSRTGPEDVIRGHVKAVNNGDIERNLTYFTDDAVFDTGDARLSGKDTLKGLMQSDAVNKARLEITEMKVEGNSAVVRLTERNEFQRLLGIEESQVVAVYRFRDRLVESVKLEYPPESARLWAEKYRPFAAWAVKEHPGEFGRLAKARPSAESARLYLTLLEEWRAKARK